MTTFQSAAPDGFARGREFDSSTIHTFPAWVVSSVGRALASHVHPFFVHYVYVTKFFFLQNVALSNWALMMSGRASSCRQVALGGCFIQSIHITRSITYQVNLQTKQNSNVQKYTKNIEDKKKPSNRQIIMFLCLHGNMEIACLLHHGGQH